MTIKSIRQLPLFCAVILLAAHAYGATFFGQDLNTTDNPATVADDPVRIVHPNADSARQRFLSNLTGVSSQSFESLFDGATAPIGVTFGTTTATITGNATVRDQPVDTFNGTYPITGNKFVLSSAGGGGTLTVTFSSPQAAFGFYATDVGDGSGELTLTLNFAAGGSTTLNVPHLVPSGSGSVLYFGVIDKANPFSSVVFGNSASSVDGFGFDDFTIGNVAQVLVPSLDVDLSEAPTKYHALTDGQMVIRYMLGLSGSALTVGAIGPSANRSDPGDITTYLNAIRSHLDVDGNTVVDVATDGLLILRYMIGFRGDALIAGAIGSTPTRSSAQDIEAWLASLMP